jgi:hypothetical protein
MKQECGLVSPNISNDNDTFIGELKYLKFQHFDFQEKRLLLT